MPNAKVLEEKKKTVAEMTERLKSKSGVFVDYRGISGIEATQMRAKLRAENVEYSVIKNSLMRRAIVNVGFDELDKFLIGTTSLATCNEDPIAPARIVKEFSDTLPDYFEIKAGFMDGKILSKEEVIAIASIPALPVLQAQFLGTLLAPISKLAVVLKAAAEKNGSPAETKSEDVKEESAKPEEAKAEEAKAEETKAEETKAEETKAEETKAEEPAKEETEAAAESPAEEPAAEKPAEEAEETKTDDSKKEDE